MSRRKKGKYLEKENMFLWRRRRTEMNYKDLKKGGGVVSLIFFDLLNFIVEPNCLFKLYV